MKLEELNEILDDDNNYHCPEKWKILLIIYVIPTTYRYYSIVTIAKKYQRLANKTQIIYYLSKRIVSSSK